LDRFIESGLSATEALDKLEEVICGKDNPIMVPQLWIDLFPGIDVENFRCHDVSDGSGDGGGRPGK
jgi:hypothetical protein